MTAPSPFWEGCRDGELRLRRCRSCGAHHHFDPSRCPGCGSPHLDWVPASGRGTIASYTRVHRAPSPAFREAAPYVLGLVDLVEGPRMMAWLVGDDDGIAVGAPVGLRFVDAPSGETLPAFAVERGV